jgi:predicted nucleotidyltransferase
VEATVITGECRDRVRDFFAGRADVRFAYLHGSALAREDPHDVDVALYLAAPVREPFEFEAAVSAEASRALGVTIDVQVLNGAPLGVLHRVFQGELLFARDERELTDLIERVAHDYSDFAPLATQYLDAVTR